MSELAIRRGAAPALAIEALSYRYPDARAPRARAASRSRSPRASSSLLAGRSASGKSTLLRAACGLVPHFHGGEIEGEVEVAGLDAIDAGPGRARRRRRLRRPGPRDPGRLDHRRGRDRAAAGDARRRARPTAPAPSRRSALALAIPHLLDRTVDTLSGGELQRVALAAALVTRPRLVLLDEPTSQLDPVAGDELIWLLRRLNEEWGVAILLAEHRLERCLAAADRVDRDGRGRDRLRRRPARLPRLGAATPTRRWRLPRRGCSPSPGIDPLPVGVRAARAHLARAGAP